MSTSSTRARRATHLRASTPYPLHTDAAQLGLRRLVVPTSVGNIVVRTGRETGVDSTPAAEAVAAIFLHGAAGSWTTWTPLLAASDRGESPLTNAILIDLPGWGESGDARRIADVEQLSDAIVEVAAALGYSQWSLVGHSLGGFIALDIAARFSEQTREVTLISASGIGVIDAIRHPVRGGLALPGFAGMLAVMRLLSAWDAAGRAVVRGVDRAGLMRAFTAPLFASNVDDSVIAAFPEEVRPASFAHAARIAAEYEMRTWTAIVCPVRSVRGSRDVFAGERDAAQLTELIRDFHEVRVPDAGHFANIERPDAVLASMSHHNSR
ncbi:alpha/beta fold hydrolase [Microbacterium sp. R86528]|uniref:alpha/beta fold hydrolase n=1 Tax=Microbacterium sp. R86528 TaxID=3093864 RepID=UPI0037C632DE